MISTKEKQKIDVVFKIWDLRNKRRDASESKNWDLMFSLEEKIERLCDKADRIGAVGH
jgi:hypothetical protein